MRRSRRFLLPCQIAVLYLFASAPLAASGWLVTAKLGQAAVDADFRHTAFDDEQNSLVLEVGYRPNRFLVLRAGFHDLGEHSGGGAPCPNDAQACIEIFVPMSADLTGLSVSLLPTWPVTEAFDIYAKVGIIDWDLEIGMESPPSFTGNLENLSQTELLYGVGLAYRPWKKLGFLLEYEAFDLDAESISAGMFWEF